jgi:hypothetical protein
MGLEFDAVNFAELSETVRFVARVASTHGGDGTKLRKSEAALKPSVFVRYEAVVEVNIVSDEDRIPIERLH